ncbi:MAG: DEAD/DEAH box helicase family protein, partial [Promethearchaeota archaeon]
MTSEGSTKKIKTSFLKEEKIEYRKYQKKIVEKCLNKNSLVVLPTGLGKTIIAVLITAKTLEQYPANSKIIMMAPTRPLINQHYDSFVKFLSIPEDKFCVITGQIDPELRAEIYHEYQMLFYTPQTLRNDLVNRRYSLKETCLIIFDEAHHAVGDYPYTLIADEYEDQNPDGIILGLTASPGSSKKKIDALCQNIHVAPQNTHFRTRKDKDVKIYLKSLDIYKIGVDLTDLMEETYSILRLLTEERLHYLSQMSFLDVKADVLFEKVIRKDLLKLNSQLIHIINGDGDKTGVYSAISINAQALILYHMIELVEQQGLDNLLDYLDKLYKDALKSNSSKAIKFLASDHKLH